MSFDELSETGKWLAVEMSLVPDYAPGKTLEMSVIVNGVAATEKQMWKKIQEWANNIDAYAEQLAMESVVDEVLIFRRELNTVSRGMEAAASKFAEEFFGAPLPEENDEC